MRIEYHRTLIADRVRLAAFRDALAAVIVPGRTTVADIGAGTGVLAFLAAKLGARRVYAYEMNEIGALAHNLKSLNRLRNVELVAGRSTDIIDPPRVDVVVSETLGNYALEEFLVETMNDARARHINPGGVLIPSAVDQLVCPVVGSRFRDELCVWDGVGKSIGIELDMTPARTMSLNNAYVRPFQPADLLDGAKAAQTWDRVDFTVKNKLARRGQMRWPVTKRTTVHGLAVWWMAQLGPDRVLSTSPLAAPTHWEQLFLPALEPIALVRGESLEAEIASRSSDAGGTDIAWTLAARDAAGKLRARQVLSLTKGFIP
jgi:SAM-dependent methyltransferase